MIKGLEIKKRWQESPLLWISEGLRKRDELPVRVYQIKFAKLETAQMSVLKKRILELKKIHSPFLPAIDTVTENGEGLLITETSMFFQKLNTPALPMLKPLTCEQFF